MLSMGHGGCDDDTFVDGAGGGGGGSDGSMILNGWTDHWYGYVDTIYNPSVPSTEQQNHNMRHCIGFDVRGDKIWYMNNFTWIGNQIIRL